MTITTTKQKLQVNKQIQKQQLSQHSTNIGTSQVTLPQLTTKQEHELLCDWENTS